MVVNNIREDRIVTILHYIKYRFNLKSWHYVVKRTFLQKCVLFLIFFIYSRIYDSFYLTACELKLSCILYFIFCTLTKSELQCYMEKGRSTLTQIPGRIDSYNAKWKLTSTVLIVYMRNCINHIDIFPLLYELYCFYNHKYNVFLNIKKYIQNGTFKIWNENAMFFSWVLKSNWVFIIIIIMKGVYVIWLANIWLLL